MANKLLTAALKKKLKSISAVEDVLWDDLLVVAKFFHPLSGWTWYVLGGDAYGEGDFLFNGAVVSPYAPDGELGYFYLSELLSVQTAFGPVTFGVERDKMFESSRLADVLGS